MRVDERMFEGIDTGLPTQELIAFNNLVELGNDAQNAVWLVERIEDRFLYNMTAKAWYFFDGKRWAPDSTDEIVRCAKSAANEMVKLAMQLHGQNREKALKYAVRCSGRRQLEAMIDLARSELPATPAEFDRGRYLLNVANGTLDLESGRLRPHNPRDRLTKLAPVVYDENARAPRWERFLEEIFRGERDVIEYVQRLFGYTLTGSMDEHVLPIFYGSGANGKSVFIGVVQKLLGDYALHVDSNLFLARREHGPTPELARLRGVRFAAASEMPDGSRLNENLVKSLTGGDRIAARQLYGETFEYEPTAKYVIATNNRPVVRDDSEGIWRRIKLIPFVASFVGSNRDLRLSEKLRDELPGILRWAVVGCERWQSDGLADPKRVVAAVAEYRSDSDAIGAFLADRCFIREGCEAYASALAAEYKAWCLASNERELTARVFRAKIRDRGIDERKSHGEAIFMGLGLRDRRDGERA